MTGSSEFHNRPAKKRSIARWARWARWRKMQFWLLNDALDKGFWSVRPRRGNSMQKMLPLLDSILIPYHRPHRGLRAMISLSFNFQVIALSYEQRALCVFR